MPVRRVCRNLGPTQLVRVAFLCVLALCSVPAFAADFSPGPDVRLQNRQRTVILRGVIEAGDAKRLETFLRQRVSKSEGGTTDYYDVAISLDSPGGDFAEGLKIANFIYDTGLGTVVQRGNTCASACALAFLGGAQVEEGGPYTDRSLEVGGRLQFHAPYVDSRNITTDQARLVRQLTDVNIELMRSMTTKFKVPPSMVDILLRNDDQHSLYTVSTIQMVVGLGIHVHGLYRPRSPTLEMAVNLCVNANEEDDGIPNPSGTGFEESRNPQGKKILRLPSNDYSDEIAIPVALLGAEDFVESYCTVGRDKDDGGLACHSVTTAIGQVIKSAGELTGGADCKINTSPSELLIVPVETNLQDFKSVVQKMEARGKSLFDVAALPSTASMKSSNTSSARGFICNDQAEFANMREGPHGKSFPVVAQLVNNTGVKVLDETSNPETGHPWLKIAAGGKEGFVDKDLVSAERCTQSVVAAVQPVGAFKPGKAVICNSEASFANMRSGPGPQNDLVMALDNYTPIKKLAAAVNEETQHPWLKIRAKGKTGYVDAEKVAASCDMAP